MKKILIIEDDPEISKMYHQELAKAGYQVSIANSGGEGLVAATQDKPDLVLVDIMMPAMDGFTVVRNLKDDKRTTKIPIIILTNLETSEIFIEEAKRLGVEHYLVKTKTSLKEMLAMIEEELGK